MSTEGANSPPTKSPKRDEDFCLIIPLPKVVFFYPTMLASLICWVMSPQVEQDIIGKSLYIGYYEQATVVDVLGETANQEKRPDWSDRETRQTWQQVAEKTTALSRDGGAKPGSAAGWIFLIVFTINILVVAFDFPGIKALAVAFFLVAGTFGGLYFNVQYNIIEPLKDFFLQVSPWTADDLTDPNGTAAEVKADDSGHLAPPSQRWKTGHSVPTGPHCNRSSSKRKVRSLARPRWVIGVWSLRR